MTSVNPRGAWALLVLALAGLNWGLYAGLGPQVSAPTSLPYWGKVGAEPPSSWRALGSEEGATLWLTDLSGPPRPYRLLLSAASGGPVELIFQAQATEPLSRAHYVRLERREGRLRVSSGYYDVRGQSRSLAERSVQTGQSAAYPTLEVDVQPRTYRLSLDGRGLFQLPLRYVGGRVLLRLPAGADGLELRALAPAAPVPLAPQAAPEPTATLLYRADFSRPDPGWRLLEGAWRWGQGYLEQSSPEGFDLAALPPAPAFSEFRLRVRLQHLEGAGGGVVFNLPTTEGLRGGHLVRFAEDGRSLFWGYFDRGGAFVGQGFAPLKPSGLDPHRLEVLSRRDTYEVRLDGATLARGVPLYGNRGFVGLTASQSRTSFTELRVERLEPEADPTGLSFLEPGLAFDSQGGRWQRVGLALYQQDPTPQEARMASRKPLELRRLRMELRPGETAEAVGVYGVPAPSDWRGGWGVRLSQGGRKLVWGRVEEGGLLEGGSLEVGGGLEPLGLAWEGGDVRLYWGPRLLGELPSPRPGYLVLQTLHGPAGFVPLEVRR
ncbi:MAG: hypothetical protein SFU83_05600 [Meiothermus sp.]|nr:hypothetical protein [Meiothermus sp.]